MSKAKSLSHSESELAEAIHELTAQVQVLRNAVDELREEFQWSNHNTNSERTCIRNRIIRSCSLAPTSPDFTVNTVSEETVEKLRSELTPIRSCSSQQGELFK